MKKTIVKRFTQFVNENHMSDRQVGGSHWLAEMDIDISYIVQDTPNEIMEVFMKLGILTIL